MIFNDSMTRRTPLTAALSSDQDRTWPIRRNIREGDGDFGYPTVLQARDGRIHLVFTSEKRTVVNHAVFDEDWVEGTHLGIHQLIRFSKGSSMIRQRNRAGIGTRRRRYRLLLELLETRQVLSTVSTTWPWTRRPAA